MIQEKIITAITVTIVTMVTIVAENFLMAWIMAALTKSRPSPALSSRRAAMRKSRTCLAFSPLILPQYQHDSRNTDNAAKVSRD